MEECNQKLQSLQDDIKIKATEKKTLEEKKADITKQLANAKVPLSQARSNFYSVPLVPESGA